MTIWEFFDRHWLIGLVALLCATAVFSAFAGAIRRRGLPEKDRKALQDAVRRLDMAAGMIASRRVTSRPGAAIEVTEIALTEAAKESLTIGRARMPEVK